MTGALFVLTASVARLLLHGYPSIEIKTLLPGAPVFNFCKVLNTRNWHDIHGTYKGSKTSGSPCNRNVGLMRPSLPGYSGFAYLNSRSRINHRGG